MGILYSYSVLTFLGWKHNHSNLCESDILWYSTKIMWNIQNYSRFKLKITECAERHSKRVAGREFIKWEFNMHYWKKQKDALLQTSNKCPKAFWGLKSGKFPELEYVRGLHNNGVSVLHKMLRSKAREIATRQGISPSQFKVSRVWMYCFMKREVT
jgi:hypothetical protein